MDLRVRPASHNDCVLLHIWLNRPIERGLRLEPNQIPSQSFKGWLQALIANKSDLSLTAELLVDGRWVPIGDVRIHSSGEIGIYIRQGYRGRRLATPIILASLDFAKRDSSKNKVVAKIRRDNIPSIRAFERAGFRFYGSTNINGYPCVEYIYDFLRMAA